LIHQNIYELKEALGGAPTATRGGAYAPQAMKFAALTRNHSSRNWIWLHKDLLFNPFQGWGNQLALPSVVPLGIGPTLG
jgi:hypothetical protein